MLGFVSSTRRRVGTTLSAVSRAGYTRPQAVSFAALRMQSTSTMHDNDPEVLEREKRRNLSGTQYDSGTAKHAPGWNEALASASEARIKADQDTSSPSELAAQTINIVRRKYDPDNASDHTNAQYGKDEVSGPLRGALGNASAAAKAAAEDFPNADEVIVHEGKVMKRKQRPGYVEEELQEDERMTISEETVKSERGELV